MAKKKREFDVFLSYHSVDADWVLKLRDALQHKGLDVWLDKDKIRPGDHFPEALGKGIRSSSAVAFVVSPESITSSWVRREYCAALLQPNDELRLIPVLLRDAKLPDFLAPLQWVDFRNRATFETSVDLLVWALTGKKPRSTKSKPMHVRKGIVSKSALRSSAERLPGEVFAVEMLRNPVLLKRKDGRLRITIDRRNVQQCVISNRGKGFKCAEFVNSDTRDILTQRDRDIQAFLESTESGQEKINTSDPALELRWASGGVLSVVKFIGGTPAGEWIPFTFRDICPYGWNINLGQPERWFDGDVLQSDYDIDEELNDPWNYISREFLEEAHVVVGDPAKERRKKFKFKKFDLDIAARETSGKRAIYFGNEHAFYRLKEDKLRIKTEYSPLINVDFEKTNCDVKIISESGKSWCRDALVCFSLLDLGIEVVKVANYRLDPHDSMLDGEILVDNRTTPPVEELVRMPVAMISCRYLKQMFDQNLSWLKYTDGEQPSIQVANPPGPDDFILYTWDIKRRIKILHDKTGSKSEKRRYDAWLDNFRHNFVDKKGKPTSASPSTLFVPGTAKILSLYFAMRRNREALA